LIFKRCFAFNSCFWVIFNYL